MLNRYGSSLKMEHRRLMRYIELKVEQHEQHQMPIPVHSAPATGNQGYTPHPKASQLPKAKAKSMPQVQMSRGSRVTSEVLPNQHPEGEDGFNSEMYAQETMMAPPVSQDPEFLALRDRLLFMENALQRVINHIENSTAPQETTVDPNDPWDA